jgi:hypothetical protein
MFLTLVFQPYTQVSYSAITILFATGGSTSFITISGYD